MKKRFGEILLEHGLINAKQLLEALELQQRRGMRLGAALVALGHLTEDQLVTVLGTVLKIEVVDLASTQPAPEALNLVGIRVAAEHDLFPLALEVGASGRKTLRVAMSDPFNVRIVDELGFITDAKIKPVLAKASDINAAINRHYGATGGPDMTMVTASGEEQVVDTSTGKIKTPYASTPVVMGRPGSQVPGSTAPARKPSTPPEIPMPKLPTAPFGLPREPSSPGLDPAKAALTRSPSGRFGVRELDMTDSFFGLVDKHGGIVDADEVRNLEKRFWALLRVLAKKGLITKEEFLAEMGDDAF